MDLLKSFIGSFSDRDMVTIPDINFCGNILNIHERSDAFGVSAEKRVKSSTCNIKNYKELELDTGLGHGFLFQALDEWLVPSINWSKGNYELD